MNDWCPSISHKIQNFKTYIQIIKQKKEVFWIFKWIQLGLVDVISRVFYKVQSKSETGLSDFIEMLLILYEMFSGFSFVRQSLCIFTSNHLLSFILPYCNLFLPIISISIYLPLYFLGFLSITSAYEFNFNN